MTAPPHVGCVVWSLLYSSSLSSNSYNVYVNPNMEIINPSDNVLDLGIFMSTSVPLSSTSKTYVKNVQTCLV